MYVVSVEEAAAQLQLGPNRDDERVQFFIDAAVSALEFHSIPLQSQTISEAHDGGDVSIWLRRPPAISIVSIVEVIGLQSWTLSEQPPGSSTSPWGYSLEDIRYGRIIRRDAGGFAFPFTRGTANIQVTYTVGTAGDTPPNLRMAVLELIRHIWQFGQQANRPAYGAPQDMASAALGPGYLIPNRVMQFLGEDERPVVLG